MAANIESSQSSDGEQLEFKVSLLGDVSVGKSSIASRFCKDFFADTYHQTLGVDFFSRTIELPGKRDATFNLFDIGGSQCGSKMLKTYIAGSDALLYVYDISNIASYESLEQWHSVASAICPNAKSVLVANKSDLAGRREVSHNLMMKMKTKIGANSEYLASAKTGDRIEMLFIQLAGILLNEDLHTMSLDQQQNARVSAPVDHSHEVEKLNKHENAAGIDLAGEIHKNSILNERTGPLNTANRGKISKAELESSMSQASGLYASQKTTQKPAKKKGFCSAE